MKRSAASPSLQSSWAATPSAPSRASSNQGTARKLLGDSREPARREAESSREKAWKLRGNL
eukprot:5404522-Alexandrium_andersonii.AAC.1